MSTHLRLGLIVLAIGIASIVGLRYLTPLLDDAYQQATSDAGDLEATYTVGVDNWVGYFPLCSRVMRKYMREAGFGLQCVMDDADYSARFSALAKGELDFAAATLDSFLLAGARHGFPGTLVGVIDESRGGDALVGVRGSVGSLDDLKRLGRSGGPANIAFTADSPSHHFLKALAVYFGIEPLRSAGRWAVETNGSAEALALLRERKVDAAVLWEPDVTKALGDKDVLRIIGTESTKHLVVDVLVAGRNFAERESDGVKTVLSALFQTLRYYRENPEELRTNLVESTGLGVDAVDAMLRGVRWTTLGENQEDWFRQQGLFEATLDTVEVLAAFGAKKTDLMPDNDPNRLMQSGPVMGLQAQVENRSEQARRFEPLSEQQWDAMRPVGTMQIRPINFSSGTAVLTESGKREADEIMRQLSHFPNLRVSISGHTGTRGDAQANRRLSQERADSLKGYLVSTHGLQDARVRALGFGGERPLAKSPGESDRRYRVRLPRVEVQLVSDTL